MYPHRTQILLEMKCTPLPIKLAPLDIHTVLSNRHAQVLHRQDRPALPTTSSATSISSPRPTKRRILSSIFLLASTSLGLSATASTTPTSSHAETRRAAQARQRVVRSRVRAANARVLVRVGGDVGDELLRRQREQARQPAVGLRWWRETRQCQVVVCDRVGDQRRVLVHLAEKFAQAGVFLLRDPWLHYCLWVCCFGAKLGWWGSWSRV